MSEYTERHTVSRLIGGEDEAESLTSSVFFSEQFFALQPLLVMLATKKAVN